MFWFFLKVKMRCKFNIAFKNYSYQTIFFNNFLFTFKTEKEFSGKQETTTSYSTSFRG